MCVRVKDLVCVRIKSMLFVIAKESNMCHGKGKGTDVYQSKGAWCVMIKEYGVCQCKGI